MKKGQIAEGVIERVDFPNKGIMRTSEGEKVVVKNAIEGQKVSALINKVRKGKAEGRLLEVLEKSPLETETDLCPHFGICGGCTYRSLPYDEQLIMKEKQVKALIDEVIEEDSADYEFLGIKPSPKSDEYRNKMEFSFGDEYRDGPLALGMHKRGSFYDIVNVPECRIVDDDFRRILTMTLEYFKERNISYFHKIRHTGYLRHLLVRKAANTGEILVDLVTTTQCSVRERSNELCGGVESIQQLDNSDSESAYCEAELLENWKKMLLGVSYDGQLKGILHTYNDSVSDTIKNDATKVLYGQDYFTEELLGLKFKITPFSFFQTNSLGAEVLYSTARDFILPDLLSDCDVPGQCSVSGENDISGDSGISKARENVIFDLYSGTGTIAQILSPVAKKVVGVEIVEEAVAAARENAALNNLSNCEFIAGDVLKVIDEIAEKPDYIVLDPPREGINPKALEKIIKYQVPHMLYISCKPTSLARDLVTLQQRGYRVDKVCCVDMFPATANVETVCLLSKLHANQHIEIDLKMDELDLTAAERRIF